MTQFQDRPSLSTCDPPGREGRCGNFRARPEWAPDIRKRAGTQRSMLNRSWVAGIQPYGDSHLVYMGGTHVGD